MKIQINYYNHYEPPIKIEAIELTCTPALLREMADTLEALPVGKGRILVDQDSQPKLIVFREGVPSVTTQG